MNTRGGTGDHKANRGGNTTSKALAAPQGSRELRIIAGSWRGRRWQFPAGTAIRPTPDRVRETLFNWLMHSVVGAHCLDLFAGSGALGLEAISRGAASVRFLDSDRTTAEGIRKTLEDWASETGEVIQRDALGWLEAEMTSPADIVFLDPPFAAGLLPRAFAAVSGRGWLSANAHIYVETAAESALPPLPTDWIVHRSGRAGEVGYYLLRRAATNHSLATGGNSNES
jgi:16S rRNA (guanine966-N2)-methyltransferase